MSSRPPEDWHVDWSGHEYNVRRPSENEVCIDGMLHPPGFNASEPSAGAPTPAGWPVLLLLPAEGGYDSHAAGEGADQLAALHAVQARQFHVNAKSHVVQLSFPHMTSAWLADGPYVQTESFLLTVLVPHLRQVLGAGPISLLGFAQGGWGAASMLFRHSSVFASAAVWDAPLLVALPDGRLAGMVDTFGTAEHYYHNYVLLDGAEDGFVASSLGSRPWLRQLVQQGLPLPPGCTSADVDKPPPRPRLALFSGMEPSNSDDTMYLSFVLTSAGVPHVFEDNAATRCPRRWDATWLDPALDFLATGAGRSGEAAYALFVADNEVLEQAEREAQQTGVPLETILKRIALQRNPELELDDDEDGDRGDEEDADGPAASGDLADDFLNEDSLVDIDGDEDSIDDLVKPAAGPLTGPRAARAAWTSRAVDGDDDAIVLDDDLDLEDTREVPENQDIGPF